MISRTANQTTVWRALAASLLIALVVFAQIQSANHYHFNEPLIADCDICLQHASSDDLVVAESTNFLGARSGSQPESLPIMFTPIAQRSTNARAPPLS
jgi:hypothetical protein